MHMYFHVYTHTHIYTHANAHIQSDHVTTRVQFGSKLETYGVVQEKIATMALHQYVTEVCL